MINRLKKAQPPASSAKSTPEVKLLSSETDDERDAMSVATEPDMNSSKKKIALAAVDPYSGSSLLPMLVSGLVLILVGMVAVAAFS
ncbi:MAG TPA: hypothetical protein VI358_16035 [Pseudolabrys sp.]